MPNRREFLQSGALLAGTVAATSSCQLTPMSADLEQHSRGANLLRGGPLLNLERAYKVMAEEGLDGLIVSDPMNVFQFSGYYDHQSVRINAPNGFVLLSADERKAPALVINQFLYYYSFTDSGFDWPGELFLFTGWGSADQAEQDGHIPTAQEPPADPPFVFSDRGDVAQRPLEKNRLQVLEEALAQRQPNAGAKWALINAARFLGLDRGRIGIDHSIIGDTLASVNAKVTTTDADHAIRRIRMIKSRREIELMRVAATMNAEAALAAVKTARAGATHRELRAEFFSECAKRGNVGMFIQVDSVLSEVYDAEFKEGESFAIDAVSSGFHYLGDYGRTVFVGEPSRSMKRATDAISLGWDAVREILRPGVRYSEIRSAGRAAIKKAGFSHLVAVTPHSVGLCHTDEPGKDGVGAYWVKDDLVLEENMVISVDMPVLHSGMGGTAHLEDLTLITKDGSTQINNIGDRTVLV